MEFISIVSHTTDRQIERLQNSFRQNNNAHVNDPDIIDVPELDDSVQVELMVDITDELPPPAQGICRWCRNVVQNHQKCIFSCSHGLGCLPCSQNFYQEGLSTEEGPKCPTCNTRIMMVIPVNFQLG